MDSRLLQDKGLASGRELLLTTGELRNASILSSDLLGMERQEAIDARALYHRRTARPVATPCR